MATSNLKVIVDQALKDLQPKNAKLARTNTDTLLKNIDDTMSRLAAKCGEFNLLYDSYIYNQVKDATMIKEKLKENVVKVINDEI